MQRVSINRLQPGLFISLSHVGWVRHPFLLNEFRISSEKQIQVLKEMGLEDVPWDPQRSTTVPLPEVARSAAPEEVDFGAAALAGMLDEKKLRMERVRRQRERLARREREYDQEISAASEILKNLGPQPA